MRDHRCLRRPGRKPASDKSRGALPRGLSFEALEPRLVLNGMPLTTADRDNLLSGLDAVGSDNDLAGWLDTLAHHGQLSTPLAIIDQSIGANVDPAAAVRLGFIQPLAALLTPLDTQTDVDDVDIVNFLNDDLRDGIVGVYDFEVVSADGGFAGERLAFDVVLRATREDVAFTTTFGVTGDALGLSITNDAAATGSADYTLNFDFSFGVDESDAFFAEIHQLDMSAAVDETAELVASSPAPPAGTLAADVELRLVVNGQDSISWTVPAAGNVGSTSNLAAQMNSRLSAALSGTPWANGVTVEERGSNLAFVASDGGIHSLQLMGGDVLGFDSNTIAQGPIQSSLEYGLLGLNVEGGALSLTAGVTSVVDHGPDGVLTTNELGVGAAGLSSQVVQTTRGSLDASLPVSLSVPGTLLSGDPLLQIVDNSPFNPAGLVIQTTEFTDITQLNRESVVALRDGLSSVAQFGGMLGQTGDFNVILPGTGKPLGELLDIQDVFQQSIVDPVSGLLDDYLAEAQAQPFPPGTASDSCWKVRRR